MINPNPEPRTNEITEGIDRFFDLYDRGLISLNTLHLLVGGTGSGKTFAARELMIPKLARRGCPLIIYAYPELSIAEPRELMEVAHRIGYEYVNNISDAIDLLELGECVVLDYCDKTVGKPDWKRMIDCVYGAEGRVLFDNGHVGFLADEAHARTSTTPETFLHAKGLSPHTFDAVYMTALKEDLFDRDCPFVFGLTATPNREHTGNIPGSTIKWSFINVRPAPSFTACASVGSAEHYHLPLKRRGQSCDDYLTEHGGSPAIMTNVHKCLENLADRMFSTETDTGHKCAGMLVGSFIGCGYGMDLDEHLPDYVEILARSAERHGIPWNDKMCAILTSAQSGFLDRSGNVCAPIGKNEIDQKVKRFMDAPKHPLRWIFVKSKGTMGINIGRIKHVMIARPFPTKAAAKYADEYGVFHFIESFLQIFGRATRLHPLNGKKFDHDGNYDLTGLLHDLRDNPEMRETLLRLNSIHLVCPDWEMWEKAVEVFQLDHAHPVVTTRNEWTRMVMHRPL